MVQQLADIKQKFVVRCRQAESCGHRLSRSKGGQRVLQRHAGRDNQRDCGSDVQNSLQSTDLQPMPEHGVYTVFVQLNNTKIEVSYLVFNSL